MSPKRSKRLRLKAVVETKSVIFCCFMLRMSFWSVSICFFRSSCCISRVLNQLSESVVVNLKRGIVDNFNKAILNQGHNCKLKFVVVELLFQSDGIPDRQKH